MAAARQQGLDPPPTPTAISQPPTKAAPKLLRGSVGAALSQKGEGLTQEGGGPPAAKQPKLDEIVREEKARLSEESKGVEKVEGTSSKATGQPPEAIPPALERAPPNPFGDKPAPAGQAKDAPSAPPPKTPTPEGPAQECGPNVPEASRTKQPGFTQPKTGPAVPPSHMRDNDEEVPPWVKGTTDAANVVEGSSPMRREASEGDSGEKPAETREWREPRDDTSLSSDEEEETEETKRERSEVQAALSKALERAEEFASRTRTSGMGEDAVVTQMLIRVRALLQQDSDSEGEDESTAKSQDAAMGSGGGEKPDPTATSQPPSPTLPQATQYRKDKGYESFTEVKDGMNFVHLCCEDSAKIDGMHLVLNQLLKHPDAAISQANDRNKYGWAPLHILANGKDSFGRRSAMIMALANMKADVEAKRGKQEMTPLHIACSTAHVDAAEALMLCGADPTVANKEGTTCWDLASMCSDEMVHAMYRVSSRPGKGATGIGRFI